jgi:hypothetical protein
MWKDAQPRVAYYITMESLITLCASIRQGLTRLRFQNTLAYFVGLYTTEDFVVDKDI